MDKGSSNSKAERRALLRGEKRGGREARTKGVIFRAAGRPSERSILSKRVGRFRRVGRVEWVEWVEHVKDVVRVECQMC